MRKVSHSYFLPAYIIALLLASGVLSGADMDTVEIIDRELLEEADEEAPAQEAPTQEESTQEESAQEESARKSPGEDGAETADSEQEAEPDPPSDATSETTDAAYAALRNQEFDVAYDLFYSLAEQDNALAQYEIGALYHRGAGVDADAARASRWYNRAAEQGYAEAQYRLGNMYLMGEGVPQSDTEALHWYEQAAQQGHAGARDNLSSLNRISTAKTREELEREAAALPPLEVNKGKPGAGETAQQRGFFKRWFGKKEKKPAKPAQQPTAPPAKPEDADIASAETPAQPASETKKKGFLSRLFGGRDKDSQTTASTAEPTAAEEQDSAPAQGGEQESAQGDEPAVAPPRPAPLAGSSAVSNHELGMAYLLGDALEQDYSKAFEHFNKAAQAGYAPAQYQLGVAYASGNGTGKDPAKAVEWQRKSAEQGHVAAQRSLALIYLNGLEGIVPDKPQALVWYLTLAEDGNQMDIHRRDALLQELSEEEIQEARAQAASLLE